MKNLKIDRLNGYAAFKAECDYFVCDDEYPGWTGIEKYGIITKLTEEQFVAKYPQIAEAMHPYVLLGTDFSEARNEYVKNEDKFEKRKIRNTCSLNGLLDEHIEAEPCVPDFVETITENTEHCLRENLIRALVYESLGALSEKQRNRLVEYHLHGKTIYELANEENISHQCINRSIKAGEKKFKKVFISRVLNHTPLSIDSEGVISILNMISSSEFND